MGHRSKLRHRAARAGGRTVKGESTCCEVAWSGLIKAPLQSPLPWKGLPALGQARERGSSWRDDVSQGHSSLLSSFQSLSTKWVCSTHLTAS